MFKSGEDISTEFIDYRNVDDSQILEDIGTDGLVDVDGTVIQSTNRYDYVKMDPREYLHTDIGKRRYRMKQRAPAQVHYCTVCNKSFKYPSKIQEHMRKHTGEKPFLCTTCGARFSQGHVLKAHVRTHQGEKPFKCSYCDRCFATTTHRNTHEKTSHHDEYQDSAKNRPCTSRDSEESDEAICYGCPFEECGFQSPSRVEVEEHLELHHYEISQEDGMEEEHIWDDYPTDMQQEPQQLIGNYQVYAVDDEAPAAHIDQHILEEAHSSGAQTLQQALQEQCQATTSTIIEEIEVETSHPTYELQVAPLKKEDLEMIMDQYPMGVSYDDAVYEGEESGTIRMIVDPRPPKRGKQTENLPSQRALVDIDIRTFEMVKPKPETMKPIRKRTKAPRNLDWIIDAVAKGHDVSLASPHNRKKPTIHKCQYCGKVDKYPSKIEAHMRTHTGEKPFKCEICGMTFSQRTPMRLHMRRHLQEKPYPCPVEGCDEAFVSGALRNQHFSKKHLKEKKYVCMKGCGRYFASCKNQRVHEEKCTYSRNLEDDPIFQQLLFEQNQMNEIYDVEETSEVNEKNWEPDPQLLEGESAALHIDNRVEETYVDEEHVEHEEYIEENACET